LVFFRYVATNKRLRINRNTKIFNGTRLSSARTRRETVKTGERRINVFSVEEERKLSFSSSPS